MNVNFQRLHVEDGLTRAIFASRPNSSIFSDLLLAKTFQKDGPRIGEALSDIQSSLSSPNMSSLRAKGRRTNGTTPKKGTVSGSRWRNDAKAKIVLAEDLN